MLLTALLLIAMPAQALKFLPYYTVSIRCAGGGHEIRLAGDFSESAFIESAIVDGVEEGPDFGSAAGEGFVTYSKPGVFSIAIPSGDSGLRQFMTDGQVRGETRPMTCKIDWKLNLLK